MTKEELKKEIDMAIPAFSPVSPEDILLVVNIAESYAQEFAIEKLANFREQAVGMMILHPGAHLGGSGMTVTISEGPVYINAVSGAEIPYFIYVFNDSIDQIIKSLKEK